MLMKSYARLRRFLQRERVVKAIYRAFGPVRVVMSLVPSRLMFSILVFIATFYIPGSRILNKNFSPIALRRLRRKQSLRLTSFLTLPLPKPSARVLVDMGIFEEAVKIIKLNGLHVRDTRIAHLLALALFELGDFEQALECLDNMFPLTAIVRRPGAMQFLGYLELLDGREASATKLLEWAAGQDPQFMCPHQNLAARYPYSYIPTELDTQSGGDGRLFDAYNFLGQRVTHVGRGDLSNDLYAAAFRAQQKLRTSYVPLSAECEVLLRKLGIELSDLRILPTEWFAQIGHEGMLDILFRMRKLGWWKGRAIMLVPSRRVANHQFLSLFKGEADILVPGDNVDESVAAELFSLQRLYGLNFNAFQFPSGNVTLWQEAGALLMQQWEADGQGYPVREVFDQRTRESELVRESLEHIKRSWGMGPNDWYVCLHMRDPSHYGEAAGTGQAHRNAGVKNYKSVLRYITEKGGWVIKLGGPHSPKLPRMPRVIDYARGQFRSEMLDLHLIRNARYFIGTTSGLTNVAISFGVPSALVNCISTDAQLWGNHVRFAFKMVRLGDGRLITQRELTSTPWRWRTFSADVLAHHNAILFDNTPDEILETVKEVELLADGVVDKYAATIPDAELLLHRWHASLSMPHFYGNALPSLYYLKKHKDDFLADVSPLPELIEDRIASAQV